MKGLSRYIAFLSMTLFASTTFAEDPPIPPSVEYLQPIQASPKVLPLLVKAADKQVIQRFQMTLFSADSGSRAIFKVRPKLSGLDLGLTLSF